MLFSPALVVVLIVGLIAGWAVHREHDQAYIECCAQWIARHELAPLAPVHTGDVLEAELLYVPAQRMDRPEVTR